MLCLQLTVRKRKSSEIDSEINQSKRSQSLLFFKWDPSRVTKGTKFVLSSTAGKVY